MAVGVFQKIWHSLLQTVPFTSHPDNVVPLLSSCLPLGQFSCSSNIACITTKNPSKSGALLEVLHMGQSSHKVL